MKDKVKAMFTGILIGDTLGLPYECRYGNYGYVDKYKTTHYSDDTQLTLAVAEAMIESNGIDITSQTSHHVKAYHESTYGWGSSTRYGIGKLVSDLKPPNKVLGNGNGIAMKVSPMGAWLVNREPLDGESFKDYAEMVKLTHPNSLGLASGLAQMFAIHYCLTTDRFDSNEFIAVICAASDLARNYWKDDSVDLSSRFCNIRTKSIKEDFGNGTPYVYDSLPFSYAYFVRNPYSIDVLYDVVSAGGDTDTNGSIVGALLGALNGPGIFPEHLQLETMKEINDCSDRFCEKFIK